MMNNKKRICPDRSDSDDNGHRTGVDDDFGTEIKKHWIRFR